MGGAAVRLDAVLAEQVAQPVELEVHPLVFGDDGLHVHAGGQLVLQPALVGPQLLFPVTQLAGAVEVPRVEGGLLLPPHQGELFHGGHEVGGDAHPDHARVGIRQPAPAGQQAQHPLTDPAVVGTCRAKDLGGHPVDRTQQGEQDVLGADVVVPQLQRLAQRQLERLLGLRRERDVALGWALAVADDLLDLFPDALERDPQGFLRGCGDARTVCGFAIRALSTTNGRWGLFGLHLTGDVMAVVAFTALLSAR